MALLAGVALPGLVAVYLLHNRKKSRVVSSLMLFAMTEAPSFGGRRLEKSRLPWMLLLELLLLALLVLAAAGPALMARDAYRPLVVVLDNSYSMQAGVTGSARERAKEAVSQALTENLGQPTRIVLAGARPVFAGDNIERKEQIAQQMEKWDALGNDGDIGQAVVMARQSLGPDTRVLVVSDRAGEIDLSQSQSIKWRAFGQPGLQFAITQASAVRAGMGLRGMVEVTNLGAQPGETKLRVLGGDGKVVKEMTVSLLAGKAEQIFFDAPSPGPGSGRGGAEEVGKGGGDGMVRVELGDDTLGLDNKVVLVAPVDRRVTVRVRIKDEALRGYVVDALVATGLLKGQVLVGDEAGPEADVLISDEGGAGRLKGAVWRLVFDRPAGATRTITGPYVVKRGHPLLEGVALAGTLWPAADVTVATQPAETGPAESQGVETQPAATMPAATQASATQPGAMLPGEGGIIGLIYAGEQPLLWQVDGDAGAMDLRLHIGDVGRTNLMQSPAWAVLFYNLLSARGLAMPGPDRSVVPLGEQTHIMVPAGVASVEVMMPDGRRRTLPVAGGQAVLTCAQVGVYRVMPEGTPIACAPLSRAESDLSQVRTGSWGSWATPEKSRERATDISWALGLAGLIVIGFHAWLTLVKKGEGA